MRYGISNLSIIPVRSEPREKSEMCTQILFGEHYTILDENNKWCQVKLAFDNYEGWIDRKMINEIDEENFLSLTNKAAFVTTDVFNIVQPVGGYSNFLIVAGSSLPDFDPIGKTFRIGNVDYTVQGNSITPSQKELREVIIENALKYFNSPYLWAEGRHLGLIAQDLPRYCIKWPEFQFPVMLLNNRL